MSQQKISPYGFGTYRVSDKNPEQMNALRAALKQGVSVIDTSTNYMDGESETAIGRILKEPEFTHLNPLIISKAGYAQGEVLKKCLEREKSARPYPEMNRLQDGLWHCISPEFLSDRLDESLARLGRVDTYLLHNPEYFLKSNLDHAEYYRRIKNAFFHLESECQKGRIKNYGVSSNTFIEAKEHPHFTSLEVLLDIAREIETTLKSPHHFRVIQFPLNLFENEAYTLNQYEGGLTLLELAQKNGLQTFANRPLNAFTEKHLVRLANYPHHHGIPLDEAIQKTLAQTISIESEFPAEYLNQTPKPVFWGHVLKDQLKHLIDIEQWRQIEAYKIRPSLHQFKGSLQNQSGTFDFSGWWERYQISMQAVLLSITYWLENEASMRSERLRTQLIQAVPKLRPSKTLSGAALRIYRSIGELNCFLVGMRKETYVEDVLTAERLEVLTSEECSLAFDQASAFRAENFTEIEK